MNVFLPARRRGVLTTIGEIHFLATPLSAFPALNKVNKRFREWLKEYPGIYTHQSFAVLTEHDIARLEVAMQNTPAMGIGNGVASRSASRSFRVPSLTAWETRGTVFFSVGYFA
jgi:hypothetical protein